MASQQDKTTEPLGVSNSNISLRRKSVGATIRHPSINTIKSDVSSVFASSCSSQGDNEMSSSSDAVVAVTMRSHAAAYQSKTSTSRLSKIPVPGASGPAKGGGLRRVNSMGSNSRSAPSSGHTTPVPPEQNKVVYREKPGKLSVDEDQTRNRLSLNEQAFRSLPSSANSSPSNKRRNGSLSSASTNSLTPGAAKNAANKKATSSSHLPLTKTNSASTPEEVRKAREKEKSKEMSTRLAKPSSGSKQRAGTQRSIPVSSSSRSHSQCSSRSESPIEQNTYTTGSRRSTMPSRVTKPNQVTKEASALAKLASRITQWAQRTQNEPETKVVVKRQQTKKSSAKSYQEIPVKRTPSPYDRTVAPPVRKSSFKLKGSRGSSGSIGSVSPSDSQLTPAGDTNISTYSDREVESPFSDTEAPIVPTSPLTVTTSAVPGVESSSVESNTAYMESSSSSYGSNTATPTTVIKKTPRDGNRHSPYYVRMTAASASKTPAGELDQLIGELNLEEIEGAVSIEADEYRRMAQEVKALKTVLLKLKRELQADHQGISSPVSSVAKGKVMKARRLSPTPPDLTVRVDQLTQEKVQLSNKLEKTKKELLSRDSKIEGLEKQLKTQQDENKQMKDKLSSLEKHREYLLDKVERLHADKHKLEDRLSVVENNHDFVDTLSDLEISDDDAMDQLKHLHSEPYDVSDGCIEENSDPESQAAMTGSLQ